MDNEKEIPKVIHYCWFGGNPLPESAVRCIESWKKYCPGYEIREWNESNYDVNACVYIQEAYRAKKWAFVSDYARFDILYSYGGLYFDTDVELIRPIHDILQAGPFMGRERNVLGKESYMVNPGLGIGAAAGMPIYKEILDSYTQMHFINPDGTYNQATVVHYTTKLLEKHGLTNSTEPKCVEDIWIYPWEYFCPMDYVTGDLSVSDNTYSIHHYSATWLNKEEILEKQVVEKIAKRFNGRIAVLCGRVYSFPFRVRKKIQQKGFRGTLRFVFKKLFR